jgi:hypothetical protein
MIPEDILKYSFPVYNNTGNTFLLSKVRSNEPYNLNIFACGDTLPLLTTTVNFNETFTLPDSIFEYENCSGDFLFETFHVITDSSFQVTATIITPVEECPASGVLNLSNANANTNGELCTNDPTILVSINDFQTSNGTLITNNFCTIGGGTFYLIDGDGIISDTLALNDTG